MTDDFAEEHIPAQSDEENNNAQDTVRDEHVSLTSSQGDVYEEIRDYEASPEQNPSFIGRLFMALGLNKRAKLATFDVRLDELSRMIRHYPDVAENYVLRGEIYLQIDQHELAHDDFQKALEILLKRVKTDKWGIIAQVMQDRAIVGLEKAQRKLTT